MSYDHDEDFNDPAQRCKHGTFIGSWWGPDYLCHYCELGYTEEEFQATIRQEAIARLTEQLERIIPRIFRDPASLQRIFPAYSPHMADWMVRHTLQHAEEVEAIAARLAELGEDVYA